MQSTLFAFQESCEINEGEGEGDEAPQAINTEVLTRNGNGSRSGREEKKKSYKPNSKTILVDDLANRSDIDKGRRYQIERERRASEAHASTQDQMKSNPTEEKQSAAFQVRIERIPFTTSDNEILRTFEQWGI
jgi:hypothetical protein